jgi:DNA adenine methylase
MNTEYRRYVLCDSNRALINFFRVLTGRPETQSAAALGISGGNNEEEF